MRTQLFTAIAAGLMMSGVAVAEETIPLTAVNKANEVIDAAIESYGGADLLNGINTVARKSEFTVWATNQSIKPGAPWDESKQMNFAAIDFENQVSVGKQKGSQGGFDFDASQVVRGDEGWNVDFRGGTVTEQAAPDFNTQTGPLIRVTAPLLVKQLITRRQTSHWLGEVEYNDRTHDVITLVMEVGPALSLYFDQETHMLSRSERVLPPFGQVDYRFADYEKIEGIPFAKEFKLYANDQPNLYIDYEFTHVNQPIDQYAAIPDHLEAIDAPAPNTEVAVQEIEEGVFLAGANGTFVMFVEMGDFIVSVGGTAGVPDRIKALREVTDKPIKYGVLTHHHNDHLLGVPAYETEGSTIFTVAAHEEVVRGTAANGEDLKLKFVDESEWIHGSDRKIQLIDIGPTPHTEHLVVAWLPEEGILFEADHFPNPATGRMVPAQSVTIRLAEVIDQRGLDVKHIVGAHSPRVATREDLNTALSLKPANLKETASR